MVNTFLFDKITEKYVLCLQEIFYNSESKIISKIKITIIELFQDPFEMPKNHLLA